MNRQRRMISQKSELFLLPCLLSLWMGNLMRCDSKIIQLDLHPTSHLVEERRRRLSSNFSEYPRHWFDRKSRAIYATLPKEEDHGKTPDDLALLDFHKFRHLSRWERKFRIENGLDLQLDWNRTYNVDMDYGFVWNRTYNRDLQQEQSLRGGQYSNYAAAPLNQGYGTHYANLWVGQPKAQRKSVIIDTGSHFTAFPCKGCENCGEEHHTDPYYDPDLSETFQALGCYKCQLGAICKDRRCYFSQAYTEGSSWEAYQVEDMVYLGGRDMLAMADRRNTDYAVPFMFGCQISENGLFVTQLADGIMGMSAHQSTLPKRLYDKKKIEHNMFALCFRRELGTSKRGISAGVMTLGGIDNRLDSSPMMFAKNVASAGWFTVYVKNIFIRAGGGQHGTSAIEEGQHVLKIPLNLAAVNSGKGVIVDSGTTDTYLHQKLASSFASMWKAVTKKEYSHNGFLLSDDQLKRLPTILVQMRAFDTRGSDMLSSVSDTIGYTGKLDPTSPHDVLLAIPATNYMEYSPTTSLYTSRLYFTETQGGVLGANAIQGHNVVFDWENGRVGFAESTCDFEDDHSASKFKGKNDTASLGNDCVLSEPVLTHTCLQSVNSKVCEQNPEELLFGTELWTRSIKSLGSSLGMSCQDIVILDTSHTGEAPPHVDCKDGLCSEYRPCQMTCNEVKQKAKHKPDSGQGSECASSWSACDESCKQSFIHAVRNSEDKCFEISRDKRDCHVGGCGKDDPCRVPYIVQATLGFRGAKKDLWTSHYSEVLATSLSETIKRTCTLEKALVSAGDINIMMTTALYDDENSNETDVEIGVKVVAQFSFYNVDAKLMNQIDEQAETQKEDEKEKHGDRLLAPNADVPTLFSKSKAKYTCFEDDLRPLAKDAFEVNDALEKELFMSMLLGEIKKAEGGDQSFDKSPFASLYSDTNLIRESSVLSSWTIRTEVEESTTIRKGILERTPLTEYSLSGRTIFLSLSVVGLVLMYIAERYVLPSEGKSKAEIEREKKALLKKKSASKADGTEEQLFTQLFRPHALHGGKDEGYFSNDDSSAASSSLLGESQSGGKSTPVTHDIGEIELPKKKKASRKTNRRRKR